MPEDSRLTERLLEAVETLTREVGRLRRGELVVRLSDLERDELAQRVIDRLDERSLPLAEPADAPPRGRAKTHRAQPHL